MKVLHINCTHYRSNFKNLVAFQRKNGLDSDVLYYTYLKHIPIRRFTSEEQKYIHQVKSKNIMHVTRYMIISRMRYVSKEVLKSGIDFRKYDVFHAHKLFTDGFIANELHKKYSVDFAVTLRNTDLNKRFYWKVGLYKKKAIEILNNSKKVIFISHQAKKRFEDLVGVSYCLSIEDKIEIIPNAIDNFWLDNRFFRKNFTLSNVKIITIGDINKNKNMLSIAKAMSSITIKKHEFTLNLVGKIKDKKYFDKIMKYKFVNYLGFLGKEELLLALRNSDLFILVSKSETFGLVYAEALSQGLPIIYSKKQGFDEFFEEGYIGASSIAKSIKDIQNSIYYIISNYGELVMNVNKLDIPFTLERITSKFQDIYLEITNKT